MSRNVNSFFSEAPASLDMHRSKMDEPHTVTTTFDCGQLIPFYCRDILPGDTVTMKTSKVVRMSTLIAPIFGDIFLDTYWFFVPMRLCWEHWKEFMGENTQSAWIPQVSYTVPQLTAPSGGWNVGTIADYLGFPTGVAGISVDATPFRAVALCCNEWFRDENLTDPLYIPVSDATVAGSNGTNYRTDVAKGGMPFIAAKFHDMYTSALPAPQKGPDTPLPLGNYAMVTTGNNTVGRHSIDVTGNDSLIFKKTSDNSDISRVTAGFGTGSNLAINSSAAFSATDSVAPANLFVDLTTATGTSINQLRQAFQVQKFYERDARSGSRYTEILRAHFSVTSPDSRLQRPEYLGGTRVPINIHQVVQNSATDSVSPQGNTAAYSLTIDSHSDFTKSFVEHGWLIGFCCARYKHSYQQSIPRQYSRKVREDYYWPVFASIGEQAVKNKEIYAQGTSADDQVFGYQEAWYEYRYHPNAITGQMRSQYATSLDLWHLGDNYSQLPSLSDAWIREDKTNLDRCLAVTSAVSHQFIADIYCDASYTRVMPLYSIPGLIDHH